METPDSLLRHGAFFGLALTLPLLLLAGAVRLIADRWGLALGNWKWREAGHFAVLGVLAGMAGQLVFTLLVACELPPEAARALGLTATAAATAAAASRTVPYFSCWKGVLFGVLAAAPATCLYHALIPAGEWGARAGVAAVLGSIIALAVTLPVPADREPATLHENGFRPATGSVGGEATLRPVAARIRPEEITLNAAPRSRRSRP